MAAAPSINAMHESYTAILQQLEEFDSTVDRLAAADQDIAVLDLHQASQLFRNTVNIVGQLRGSELQPSTAPSAKMPPRRCSSSTRNWRGRAAQMVELTQAQTDRVTKDYLPPILALAKSSTAQ